MGDRLVEGRFEFCIPVLGVQFHSDRDRLSFSAGRSHPIGSLDRDLLYWNGCLHDQQDLSRLPFVNVTM